MPSVRTLHERLVRHPRWLQLFLDAAFVTTAVATFGQVWDPDVLFHLIWVILTIEAFLFGFRVTAVRIGLALILLLGYFNLATMAGPNGPVILDLDLAEWPLMTVIAVIVAVMADRVAATSRHYAELYRAASDRLMTAQEDERKRLGRDLHDGVGQTLSAVVLTLDAAETLLWSGDRAPPAAARAAIQRAQELSAIALDETRDVAYRLRPGRFVETGLVAAANRLAASAGATVVVIAEPDLAVPGLFAPDDEMNIYRVIQEALNNALRHAKARHIRIEFATHQAALTVSVADDGIGFDAKASEQRGLGLAGMRERALILGADLQIISAVGKGSKLALTIPMHERAAASNRAIAKPAVQGGTSS